MGSSPNPEVFTSRSACNGQLQAPSSRRVPVPFRVSPSVRARSPSPSVLSWDSVPYGAYNVWSPLVPGLPHPVRCAFRVSHPLGAFLLQTPPGIFHPVAPLGFALQSLAPRSQPGHPLGAACPPAGCLRAGPASGLLANCGAVSSTEPLRRPPGPLLSWASSSPGVSPASCSDPKVDPLVGLLSSARCPERHRPPESCRARRSAWLSRACRPS